MIHDVAILKQKALALKNANLTKTESTLIDYLVQQEEPFTGEEIFFSLYDRDRSLKFSTVYACLCRLVSLGILKATKYPNNRKKWYLFNRF